MSSGPVPRGHPWKQDEKVSRHFPLGDIWGLNIPESGNDSVAHRTRMGVGSWGGEPSQMSEPREKGGAIHSRIPKPPQGPENHLGLPPAHSHIIGLEWNLADENSPSWL